MRDKHHIIGQLSQKSTEHRKKNENKHKSVKIIFESTVFIKQKSRAQQPNPRNSAIIIIFLKTLCIACPKSYSQHQCLQDKSDQNFS